jgi:hypothetical protein
MTNLLKEQLKSELKVRTIKENLQKVENSLLKIAEGLSLKLEDFPTFESYHTEVRVTIDGPGRKPQGFSIILEIADEDFTTYILKPELPDRKAPVEEAFSSFNTELIRLIKLKFIDPGA